ncbi:hypothetical protein D3C81_1742890 [compost metagenome]
MSFTFIDRLSEIKRYLSTDTIKTFIVANGGHATAVAMSFTQIAFFDSDEGMIIYFHSDASFRKPCEKLVYPWHATLA